MKFNKIKLIAGLCLALGVSAFGQNNVGTLVTDPVRPFSVSSTHPSAIANEIKGGPFSSSNLVGLSNIPAPRLEIGSIGYATNTGLYYRLTATNPATWSSINGGNVTNLNASNIVGTIPASNIPTVSLTNISGTLAVSSGGTGATNAGGARTNLGLGWSALTNTNASTSLLGFATNGQVVANTGTNVLTFTNIYGVQVDNLVVGDTDNKAVFYIEDEGLSISVYRTNAETYIGNLGFLDNSVSLAVPVTFNNATNAAITRANLGLGWPALINTNAGTGLVSVNTNGVVVSPTNFWQVAPIQTLVQDFTLIGGTQTNNATNARNLYVYSLNTNLGGISNTIILPTNTATFNGDEATVVHKGTTNTTTVVRQAGSTNNLITLSRFDESVKFIRESGQWDFYHNISFVEPIQFSGTNASANAAASRTNLGLGANNTINFGNVNALQVVVAGTNIAETGIISGGGFYIYDENTNTTAEVFNFGGDAENRLRANARTNLGLGATWLTNTNVTNFRSAIGATASGGNGQYSILVRNNDNFDSVTANGRQSITIGTQNASANGSNSVAIGADGVVSSGFASVALGGADTFASGNFSMAAGFKTRATNIGAFVWQSDDGTDTNGFSSTNNLSFNVRAIGGMSLDLGTNGIIFRANASADATRTNLGLGATNIVTFAGLTNNGDITINQTAASNGLLFVYRTNNEPFLGLANLIASNNTTVSNETLFRVGVAEATNRSAQFGFRSTNTNGNGVAVFSVFGYNALMMIGPSDPAAGTNPIEATVYSVNPTNKVMTLIKTNTGATMFHRPIEFENTTNQAVTRTNLGLGATNNVTFNDVTASGTLTATSTVTAKTNLVVEGFVDFTTNRTNSNPATNNHIQDFIEIRVGTNQFWLPLYK